MAGEFWIVSPVMSVTAAGALTSCCSPLDAETTTCSSNDTGSSGLSGGGGGCCCGCCANAGAASIEHGGAQKKTHGHVRVLLVVSVGVQRAHCEPDRHGDRRARKPSAPLSDGGMMAVLRP